MTSSSFCLPTALVSMDGVTMDEATVQDAALHVALRSCTRCQATYHAKQRVKPLLLYLSCCICMKSWLQNRWFQQMQKQR